MSSSLIWEAGHLMSLSLQLRRVFLKSRQPPVIPTWVGKILIIVWSITSSRISNVVIVRIWVRINVRYVVSVRHVNVPSVHCQVRHRHILRLIHCLMVSILILPLPVLDLKICVWISSRSVLTRARRYYVIPRLVKIRLMRLYLWVGRHVSPRSNLCFRNSLMVRSHASLSTPMRPLPSVPPSRLPSCPVLIRVRSCPNFFFWMSLPYLLVLKRLVVSWLPSSSVTLPSPPRRHRPSPPTLITSLVLVCSSKSLRVNVPWPVITTCSGNSTSMASPHAPWSTPNWCVLRYWCQWYP